MAAEMDAQQLNGGVNGVSEVWIIRPPPACTRARGLCADPFLPAGLSLCQASQLQSLTDADASSVGSSSSSSSSTRL